MSNFSRTAAFLDACDKEKTVANVSVQIGQYMWAFLDFLESVSVSGPQSESDMDMVIKMLRRTGGAIKRGQTLAIVQADNRVAALSALCAVDAFGNAVAHLAEMDKEGADNATLIATEAMLVNGEPVLMPGGKIGTPEGWIPADLSRFA